MMQPCAVLFLFTISAVGVWGGHMCGPCLCAPPTLLCSGSLVRSIPPTTKRVSEGTKVLRHVNTFVHDIKLKQFLNLERLVERHNPMLQCKSLRSQLASLSRAISVASDCLDQNSPRQSLGDIATTPGVGGGGGGGGGGGERHPQNRWWTHPQPRQGTPQRREN